MLHAKHRQHGGGHLNLVSALYMKQCNDFHLGATVLPGAMDVQNFILQTEHFRFRFMCEHMQGWVIMACHMLA